MATLTLSAYGWALTLLPAVIWVGLLMAPWQPWSTRERLEADSRAGGTVDLSDITVLIPARNEADTLGVTLTALQAQGTGLQVVVIDDQSSDATATVATAS